jgi:hypothetical protein
MFQYNPFTITYFMFGIPLQGLQGIFCCGVFERHSMMKFYCKCGARAFSGSSQDIVAEFLNANERK